ncbi:type II secretion system F family protein [Sulfurimonas sp. MAG313]|nr:type II secretion system F family protein [Sulfurimonas sp. MAG313]MDF1881474.1 type II secretion system F family protein [Sulfurimonas sp. MAG313]
MKINLYTMLKTLLFTLQNGKNISSGLKLLSDTAKTKSEKKVYMSIYSEIKEGLSFSEALDKNKIGSYDVIQFVKMAEQGVSFKKALEKVISYLEVKEKFERDSNEHTSLPFIYFSIATLIVLGVKFIGVPYQMSMTEGYSIEIKQLVGDHLDLAQWMSNSLFFALLLVAGYFMLLMISLFSQTRAIQTVSKKLALVLPFTSKIVLRFEKFMLFSMLGEMLQSGISFKKAISSAIETSTVNKHKKALSESLDSIKYNGKFILHNDLYDDIERNLLTGVGSSSQVGSVMLEISDRARADALRLSTNFFRMITLMSILLMAYAVFIEFYTVVLTQILIQKGLIDMTRGVGTFI